MKSAARNAPKSRGSEAPGFTEEERAALAERARELKARGRRPAGRDAGEKEVLARIGEMQGSDREIAERLHAIIRSNVPSLVPRTWYGMPAYEKDGKVLCFFQSAQKFKSRYPTLGFSDKAKLDEGDMWPTAFALRQISAVEEARILELLQRALRE